MIAAVALVALPVLPLIGALAALIAGRHGAQVAGTVAAAVAVAVAVLIAAVAGAGVQRVDLGGWTPPLGIALMADGLAASFLAMAAVVMTAVIAQAAPQFTGRDGETRAGYTFWPLALWLWAALNLCLLSRDLFNLYVALELLTLAAIALVAIGGRADTLAAALRYMVFALMGSLLYLLGAVLLYAAHGTLDIDLLAIRAEPAPPDLVAAGLVTAGLAVKTALFPFHAWLPPAHSGAPAPASAMLSALVPKASFFILWRLWFEALPDLATPGVLNILAGLGAAAVLYGSLLALRQERLKLIVAYSTVAQVGYLFLLFPLAGGVAAAQPWAAGAWTGTAFQALSHGLAKAAMFLCAGLWMAAVGHDRLEGLRGLVRAMPMSVFAFGLAAIALMGLPPSGGFTAKYLLMTSAFAAGQLIWALVLIGGGLLAAAYLYRPTVWLFARAQPDGIDPAPRWMQAVPLALAALAILLGILSDTPFAFMQIGRPEAAEEGL